MDIMRTLKRSSLARSLYKKLQNEAAFSPDSIKVCDVKLDSDFSPRLNLLLLGLKNDEVYGGVSTALNAFSMLGEKLGCRLRIIVTGNQLYSDETYVPEGFGYSNASDKQLYFVEDDHALEVCKNDIFVFTYWSTWFSMEKALDYRDDLFGSKGTDVYLIQDFEPGFFPWSTEYLLAESTYKSRAKNTIALINSKELGVFLDQQGYSFKDAFIFDPVLNGALKSRLLAFSKRSEKRNKRILIYGRPSAERNAFQLIVSSLRRWSDNYDQASEWEIISLGEKHEDIVLSNNVIKSYGKATLDEYANIMKDSYAGISLMASPHPSYPPLEMSAFGVKTITNEFANKNLRGLSPNLVVLAHVTPSYISESLAVICSEYSGSEGYGEFDLREEYINGISLGSAINSLAEALLFCDVD